MDTLASRRLTLLALGFDDLNPDEAAHQVLTRRPDAPFAYVVTPNADHLQRLHRQLGLRPAYEAAWLCLLDSRLIARVATWLGHPVPSVVTGADLTAILLPRLAGRAVAIIGMGAPAVRVLQDRYPGTAFHHHEPPMGLAGDPAARACAQSFIENTAAHITFLAVGSPAQELLAYDTARAGRATGIGLCIGSALEFCAGTRSRAPRLLRRFGLEWAWRLACEPRRLAIRYLVRDPPVLLRLIGEAVRRT